MTVFNAGAVVAPILRSGDDRLRLRSKEVDRVNDALMAQGSALIATLHDFRERSGFGRAISAPQIGWLERVVAMNLGDKPFLLINPEITWRSEDTFLVWDDCLSVPEVIVRVRRNTSVSLTFRDHEFQLRRWTRLPRDLSELVQHELDHLNGVLMTDLAEGDDGVQPLTRWKELVGPARSDTKVSLGDIERVI